MKKLCLLLACTLGVLSAGAAPPGIVSPPQSITANNGSAATFTVIATNAATYQWYFQGTNLLAGATNAALSLDDLSTNNAGSYTVVVTSSDDTSVSNSPPAVLAITQGTIIQWNISTYPGGGSNSFLVQLFDHDKPATVANFIHYVASGALSNTFFDTASNYVLQGGDYATADRGANHLAIQNLAKGTNIFPAQINSEFSLGAIVPNTFGTLAARESGQHSAGTGAFFFNLTDNTSNLDAAGYTVFGRIVDGSNTLQYFTTLSAGNGLYSNASPRLNVLPVNYSGTNKPSDASLFYSDFQFISPTNPPVETAIPVVSITSPAPNAALTNGFSLTARGTAQDSFALADVYCVLSSVAGASPGENQTNFAQGTTNWSVAFGAIQAGVYQLTAYAQDAGGTLSAPVTEYFTNQAILTIITNIDGKLSTNTPIYLTPGQQYSFTAPAIAGEMFVDWQVGGVPSLNPVQTITAGLNLTMEVTYAATNLTAGLDMTNPAANSVVQAPNGNLTISGTIPSSTTVTQLTVQLFSQSNSVTGVLPAVITGTNWSLAESNLVGGPYLAVVVAKGPSGQVGLLAQNFTALTGPPVIISGPQSTTNNVASAADFSVTASNTVSYQWQQVGAGPIAGATSALLALDDLETNQSGAIYQVVLTAPDGETLTSAPATLTVVPGTVIQWTISTYPDGSSNSFLVELFAHDKPATVENFIHYITSGAYSNMFFDRDVANFVLQGGDYATDDRSTNLAVQAIGPGDGFPSQVASEFNTGPLIHNEFGTLAMALQSGKPNSASSAFFFNLTNNSASLDAQDFTVFGRVLTGANVLQYFNTLSAPSNGIYDGFQQVATLPVNYDGANEPTDSNFFYCDFAFVSPSTAPVNTNIPTVSIAYPLANAAFTNAGDLTATGTASGMGIAEVYCALSPLTGLDAGQTETNIALGTLDWSLDLGVNPPGIYQFTAYAEDGSGNLSAPTTEFFTNLLTLTIITNDAGALSTNIQYLLPDQSYSAVSAPADGGVFVDWTVQGTVSLNPVQTVTLKTNITLEVTYAATNFPPGLAITSPAAGASVQTTNAALTISGTIPASVTVSQVTVQLFANSNAISSPRLAAINGTNWSVTVSNLAGGPYLISVTASDTLLQEGFVSETFTALIAPPVIVSLPQTVTVNAGSSAALTVAATNAISYQWQLVGSGPIAGATSSTLVLNNVGMDQSGVSYQVVLESRDTQIVTGPPVVLMVETGTIVQLTISKFPDGSSNTVQVELFDHDKPGTVANFIHYVASGAYSNTFFDTASNYVLQGGDYATADRGPNHLTIQNLAKGTNIFPAQINSEFSLGAIVPNTFGTLAARESGQHSAGTGAFFFNLTDNTSNLDAAGYTVFGRILDGSNTLQYFTNLSAGNGLYSNASPRLNVLPVNYSGTNKPSDASLFYCDFQFISPTNPPVETAIPVVSITSPAPNAALTNGFSVTARGTAQDSFALANVYCVISSVAGAFPGEIQTNFAQGTTNWSVAFGAIQAGVYQLTAYAQDAGGTLSAPVTEFFTNQAVLTIITNIDGKLSTNAPIYLTPGQQYSFTAPDVAGETFVEWQVGGVPSLDLTQIITAGLNLTMEVTYATNPIPGLAMTSPAANASSSAPGGNLTITGTIPSSTTVTQLTVQLFSLSNPVTAVLPAVITGTNWSLAESNLLGGPYLAVVVATGPSGQVGLLEQNFTALTGAPTIASPPQSTTNNVGSSADISISASNVVSYQWQQVGVGPIAGATNAFLGLNDLTASQSGSAYQVVMTSPDGEVVTSGPAVLTVVQGTIIQCTVSTFPGGGSNSFLVELFDQDKPATVENFIHYITSGAFSNTFFDTDVTNSALLGGAVASTDRTGNPLNVHLLSPGSGFPAEIESEFNVGPFVPNDFGTLASFSSANSGYGAGAFIFNLTNNSPDFDFEGYAVFGRIISGTNVLQYFNTLSAPSNGLYAATNFNLPLLPVNYNGINAPANSNLFYCDFKLISPTNAPVDTNIPRVSLTFPATNAFFTNLSDLTITGTASGVGLAEVYIVLTSLEGATSGEAGTNFAQGTTNWSLDLGAGLPGIFQLTAYAEDGGGNVSAPATVFFTNMAQLIIITNIGGQLTTNGPQYLVPGTQETITAAPGPGQQFYNWTVNGTVSINPVQKIILSNNVTLVVTYLPTNASTAVTITSPAAGKEALAIQSVLSVSGTIGSPSVTQLTCQFFVQSNAVEAPLPAIINGTNWSLAASNLSNGSYTMVAVASGAGGPISSASVSFTLTNVEMLTLNTNGQGTIVNTNGYPYLTPGTYTVKAVPAKGYAFYDWSDGVHTSVSAAKTFQITSNLTLTATFVPNDAALTGISITYPPANAMLTNGTFKITGTLPHSQVFTQMTCQLFLQSNSPSAAGQPVAISSNGTSWSLPVSNIVAGPYNIEVLAYDAKGNSKLVSSSFNLLSKLTVNVQGPGSVTAGLNGKYLQVGKSYTIKATPKPNQIFAFWTGAVENPAGASTAFIMSTNLVLTANFTNNPFPAVAGTYSGLFLDPAAVSPTNAGFVRLTVTTTGSFSGSLMFPSITYPVSYAFPYNGQVILPSAPNVFDPSNHLQLVLNLDLTNGTDTIEGFLADITSGGDFIWLSGLVLNRNITKLAASNSPAAGHYVLLDRPDNGTSPGYGAESLLSSGALTLTGALPDNAALFEAANISKDGIWPVYIVPATYAKKGLLIGWQTNSPSGACSGQLFWYKPSAGVATNLTADGATFVAPAANSQYQMVLDGGNTYPLAVNKLGHFVAQSPITSITLQATGLLTGSIASNKTSMAFKGAFISPSQGGAGYVIEPGGHTEGFQIMFAP